MRKINKMEINELYSELMRLTQENDIEFLSANYILDDTTTQLDTINQFVFQIFNTKLDREALTAQIEALTDEDFGHYTTHYINDILIVFIAI